MDIRKRPPAPSPQEGAPDEERLQRVTPRDDGDQAGVDGRGESAPFESLDDALARIDGGTEEAIERCETVEDAEQGRDASPDSIPHEDEPETAT